MLYWLQQERRKRALDMMLPTKEKHLQAVPVKSVDAVSLVTNWFNHQKYYKVIFKEHWQPSRHYVRQNQEWKQQNNGWNLFKVDNKDTRTTWRRSGVLIVNFEQIYFFRNFDQLLLLTRNINTNRVVTEYLLNSTRPQNNTLWFCFILFEFLADDYWNWTRDFLILEFENKFFCFNR